MMLKKKIKKQNKPKLLPKGTVSHFLSAKKLTGINIRVTIKNYRKKKLVKDKIFTYFYKKLDVLNLKIKEKHRKSIHFLKRINCYKGARHTLGLPVRGQRTKTNAKTRIKNRNKFIYLARKKRLKKYAKKRNSKK